MALTRSLSNVTNTVEHIVRMEPVKIVTRYTLRILTDS